LQSIRIIDALACIDFYIEEAWGDPIAWKMNHSKKKDS
jgi:hypothetical protein